MSAIVLKISRVRAEALREHARARDQFAAKSSFKPTTYDEGMRDAFDDCEILVALLKNITKAQTQGPRNAACVAAHQVLEAAGYFTEGKPREEA